MAGLILPPAPRGARAGAFSDYLKRQQYARDASMSWFYTHLMPPRPSSVCDCRCCCVLPPHIADGLINSNIPPNISYISNILIFLIFSHTSPNTLSEARQACEIILLTPCQRPDRPVTQYASQYTHGWPHSTPCTPNPQCSLKPATTEGGCIQKCEIGTQVGV